MEIVLILYQKLRQILYNHKCIIWLVTEEESPLTFSVQILADYCVLFDAVLNQVAFAPRVAKSKDMEWIECWKEG
ncbi:unnamed protein product [Meloidogyne enterolobii]|uniref:Uncharacterized protein n=1 Tax=Meloidogyne enterolobii TaxID=390850 RepID=A0ACB0YNE0_MELEN